MKRFRFLGTAGGCEEYETENGEWVKFEDIEKSTVLELNGQKHIINDVIFIDGKIKVKAHHFASDPRRSNRRA